MTSMRGVPENNGEMLLLLQTNELVKQHKKHKNEKRNSSKVHVFPACVSIRNRERERSHPGKTCLLHAIAVAAAEHFWRNSLIPWYVINYSHQVKVKGAKKKPHERRRIKKNPERFLYFPFKFRNRLKGVYFTWSTSYSIGGRRPCWDFWRQDPFRPAINDGKWLILNWERNDLSSIVTKMRTSGLRILFWAATMTDS